MDEAWPDVSTPRWRRLRRQRPRRWLPHTTSRNSALSWTSAAATATLIGSLTANPRLRGIVFDREGAAKRATENLAEKGLAERSRAVAGDFFQKVPDGADAYLPKHVIHDWDDAQATAILRVCHRAMRPGAKLLIAEASIRHIDQSPEAAARRPTTSICWSLSAAGNDRTGVSRPLPCRRTDEDRADASTVADRGERGSSDAHSTMTSSWTIMPSCELSDKKAAVRQAALLSTRSCNVAQRNRAEVRLPPLPNNPPTRISARIKNAGMFSRSFRCARLARRTLAASSLSA